MKRTYCYSLIINVPDSAVGIATGYGLDDKGIAVRVPVGQTTEASIQWAPVPLSPGVKRPGYETDHSPPTSAEVKKTWVYTSTPPYIFMA
jgi:hypothetical protein